MLQHSLLYRSWSHPICDLWSMFYVNVGHCGHVTPSFAWDIKIQRSVGLHQDRVQAMKNYSHYETQTCLGQASPCSPWNTGPAPLRRCRIKPALGTAMAQLLRSAERNHHEINISPFQVPGSMAYNHHEIFFSFRNKWLGMPFSMRKLLRDCFLKTKIFNRSLLCIIALAQLT